jgi:hypothetical protein
VYTCSCGIISLCFHTADSLLCVTYCHHLVGLL